MAQEAFFPFRPALKRGWNLECRECGKGFVNYQYLLSSSFFFVSVPCLMLDKLNEMIGDLFGDRGGRGVLLLINSTITK